MSKPVHLLQCDCEVEEIVAIAAIAVVDAQETEVALSGELQPNEKVAAFLPTAG